MDLRFVEDPPPARAAAPPLERRSELGTKHRARIRVPWRATGCDVQRPAHDFRMLMLRHALITLVELTAPIDERLRHAPR